VSAEVLERAVVPEVPNGGAIASALAALEAAEFLLSLRGGAAPGRLSTLRVAACRLHPRSS
jgi:hypothetical protein